MSTTTWTATFRLTGPVVDGDLTMGGFYSQATALEVAACVADALRTEYPGTLVTAHLQDRQRHSIEDVAAEFGVDLDGP